MRSEHRIVATDAAVALVALTAVQVEIWGFWVVSEQGPRAQAAVFGALMAVPLAARRRRPVAAFGAVLVTYAAWVAVAVPQGSLVPFLIELLAVFSVARLARLTAAAICLGAAVGVEVCFVALTTNDFADYLFILAFVSAAWAAGRGMQAHQQRADRLFAETVRLEVEKEERARQAADDERTRIARELHDVIAHGVSVMVVQAAAAEQVLFDDPAAARTSLRSVQEVGREARLELRRMLGLIRSDPDADPLAPTPGLRQLPELVEQFALAGLDVDLNVSGVSSLLPAGLELTAYRVAQEALTNAVKHGTGSTAELVVRQCGDQLTIEVVNPAQPQVPKGGPGYGLRGMQERVTLYGGELRHGRRADGCFRVLARLPVPEATT